MLLCLNFVSAISSFGVSLRSFAFPCLLRLILIIFLVLLRLLVLVLRTGAPARVGGCRSVLEPGSWSTPSVVRSFVVSSMMELRHKERTMVGALGRSFFHRLFLCVSPVCLFACMFVRWIGG